MSLKLYPGTVRALLTTVDDAPAAPTEDRMIIRPWIIVALISGVFACSSGSRGAFSSSTSGASPVGSGNGDGNGAATGTSQAHAGSGGGGTASTGATTPGSGNGGSDAGAQKGLIYDSSIADADIDQPITLTMTSFTVHPNEEVYKCQWFGNPFGHDVDLVKMVGHMDQGSHHFFLFNMSPVTLQTGAQPLSDCPTGGLEFYPFPYLSQQQDWTVEYPQPNMGYPLVAKNGLMMNAHFLNAGSQDITPQVTITIYPAKPGVVTVKVGSIFLNNQAITVPAMTSTPIAITDSLAPISDEDYTIFTHWSHMHKYATDFKATIAGQVVYDETDWSEPRLVTKGSPLDKYNSLNLPVKSGATVSWTCMYTNPTSSAMVFGESADTTDMCIYIAQYYPADGTPDTNVNYPDIVSGFNL